MMRNDGSTQPNWLLAAPGIAAYRLPTIPRPQPMEPAQAQRHQEAGRVLLLEGPRIAGFGQKLCETLSTVTRARRHTPASTRSDPFPPPEPGISPEIGLPTDFLQAGALQRP
jgi:hypothetical protein